MSIALICSIIGSSFANAFPVDIDRSHLKKLSRRRNNKHPLSQGSIELLATRKISKYFLDSPAEEHIHVLIEQPVILRNEISNLRELVDQDLSYLESLAFDAHQDENSLFISPRNMLKKEPSFIPIREGLAYVQQPPRRRKSFDTEGDPAEVLTEKLIWTYRKCLYIFGYYARATTVINY
ncbi:hypothetical protein Glove_141g34 [Diversispora epigaea]|uniref:Uncharacterized protein n=1 Tax=Diversispora epigaea TaxID=1348612 RepID=A0A397IUU3_9GLOM|nr:hypothetical protein Glove_141g34 [Diversispora epigaea]